ncbi:P-loop NTPase [Anabaena sp. WFMT]|uniref:P-loop NTPase n=1 Tax=Anabaena sp. WFMT TaxID=3449730 RepID=UPI003F29DADF
MLKKLDLNNSFVQEEVQTDSPNFRQEEVIQLLKQVIELTLKNDIVSLGMVQESPICGVILVTTPQEITVPDVRRSIYMFRQVGVPVLGIIENMSFFIGVNGDETPIFGSGGGEKLSNELQAPLLGKIPLDPRSCNGGDTGQPLTLADSSLATSQVFIHIAAAMEATFLAFSSYL